MGMNLNIKFKNFAFIKFHSFYFKTTLAYIWTFFFKSEIIGFVVLLIVLGIGAFIDMIWSFIILLIQTNASSTKGSKVANLINLIRWIFTILFPNISIKRAMFDLKINNNSFCLNALNNIIYSKIK